MDFCPAQGFSDQSIQFLSHKKSFNLASALVLAILGKENVEGLFFSNLSVGSSPAWYFHLTPFETLFCGMIILQIFVLRWVEILPINLNNWLIGDPSGRRKRSTSQRRKRVVGQGTVDHLAEATFAVLRRLDDQDCLLKSLCILQVQSLKGSSSPNIPKETKIMVTTLEMLGNQRRKNMTSKCSTRQCHNGILTEDDDQSTNVVHDEKSGKKTPTIQVFEDAVLVGSKIYGLSMGHTASTSNVTQDLCGSDYKACSVSSKDIIDYIDIIADAGML